MTILSATVSSAPYSNLVLTFTMVGGGTLSGNFTGFSVETTGNYLGVVSAANNSIFPNRITLTLTRAVSAEETLVVNYTPGNVKDNNNDLLLDFGLFEVTNGSTIHDPSCPWFTYTQFANRFGLKNITTASNKENTTTDPNLSAVQDAFDEALETVQDAMRGGAYAIPFDFTPNGGQCPWKIRAWAMVIAYGVLYIGGRGLQEKRVDPMGDRISKLVAAVHREIGFAKVGLLQLNIAPAKASTGSTVSAGAQVIHSRHRGFWERFGLDSAPTYCGY